MWVERGTDLTEEKFVRELGPVVETRRRTRRSVKTRIQNPRHRIQPNWTDWELEWWSGVQNGVVESLSDGLATDGTPIKHGCNEVGQMVGKRTGFSHVFPQNSTQVVDFQHLSRLRVEGVYELRVRSWELRKKVAEGGWSVRKSADCYGLLRESSRKFAQIRSVNPRLFGLLHPRAFLDANLGIGRKGNHR